MINLVSDKTSTSGLWSVSDQLSLSLPQIVNLVTSMSLTGSVAAASLEDMTESSEVSLL